MIAVSPPSMLPFAPIPYSFGSHFNLLSFANVQIFFTFNVRGLGRTAFGGGTSLPATVRSGSEFGSQPGDKLSEYLYFPKFLHETSEISEMRRGTVSFRIPFN